MRCLAVFALLLPTVLTAQGQVDTSAAQTQMFDRINAVVDKRAKEPKIDRDVVTYCRIEMSLHTAHSSDGSIPFGVNYNKISDAKELKTIIDAREAYEKSYLLLCISRAQRDLSRTP